MVFTQKWIRAFVSVYKPCLILCFFFFLITVLTEVEFMTKSQSVPKPRPTIKWAYYITIQSKLRNSADYCRSMDLWLIQFWLTDRTIYHIAMWVRISFQPDFWLGNPKFWTLLFMYICLKVARSIIPLFFILSEWPSNIGKVFDHSQWDDAILVCQQVEPNPADPHRHSGKLFMSWVGVGGPHWSQYLYVNLTQPSKAPLTQDY